MALIFELTVLVWQRWPFGKLGLLRLVIWRGPFFLFDSRVWFSILGFYLILSILVHQRVAFWFSLRRGSFLDICLESSFLAFWWFFLAFSCACRGGTSWKDMLIIVVYFLSCYVGELLEYVHYLVGLCRCFFAEDKNVIRKEEVGNGRSSFRKFETMYFVFF